ncbi:MAG: hypothetical protein ABI723_08690 [Bacteroidia bacterium]
MKNTFKLIAVAVALTAAVACSGNKTAESTTATDSAATVEATNAMVDSTANAANAMVDSSAAAAGAMVDSAADAMKK